VHVLLSKSTSCRAVPPPRPADGQRELKKMGMNASVQLFSSLKRVGVDQAEGVVRNGWARPKKTRPIGGQLNKPQGRVKMP
jgi:hypothetical protein